MQILSDTYNNIMNKLTLYYFIMAVNCVYEYRFLNANKENAFKNPAEPDGFLAEAKKPRVRMSNFWGNSISYNLSSEKLSLINLNVYWLIE